MRSIITLTTDFGHGDFEIGALYGVIWSIAPQARIIDFTHNIERHAILEAALNLSSYAPFFPSGSIHVAVVDPGVGTKRRSIAARLGEQYFVGPDNGLLSLLLKKALNQRQTVEVVHLDQPQFWMPQVCDIFHGRDIFAPVAGHLAKGTPLKELGSPIPNPVLLDLPAPQKTSQGWKGQVIQIDRFGNLTTNLESQHFEGLENVIIFLGKDSIEGLCQTFGERQPGESLALLNSAGNLMICVANGNAAQKHKLKVGDSFEVKGAGL